MRKGIKDDTHHLRIVSLTVDLACLKLAPGFSQRKTLRNDPCSKTIHKPIGTTYGTRARWGGAPLFGTYSFA